MTALLTIYIASAAIVALTVIYSWVRGTLWIADPIELLAILIVIPAPFANTYVAWFCLLGLWEDIKALRRGGKT